MQEVAAEAAATAATAAAEAAHLREELQRERARRLEVPEGGKPQAARRNGSDVRLQTRTAGRIVRRRGPSDDRTTCKTSPGDCDCKVSEQGREAATNDDHSNG